MKRWIVFDAMGVIFEVGDDTNDLLVPFVQQRHKVSKERINELYIEASLGRITSERFWNEVGLGTYYPAIQTEYLDTCLTLDREFPIVVERLAARYFLGLLSNDVGEWSVYLMKKHSLEFFDVVVVSGFVGYRKPDLKIYEIFLQEAKATAGSCVFVDDRHKNLRTAKTLGFKTIHFERTPELNTFTPDARIRSFVELEEKTRRIC
ncbi:MAG: HAD-IA family hydrolase [bacterium]